MKNEYIPPKSPKCDICANVCAVIYRHFRDLGCAGKMVTEAISVAMKNKYTPPKSAKCDICANVCAVIYRLAIP